jgi:nucleoid-associated protein
MQIQEAILHKISKEEKTTGADSVSVTPRKTRLAIDDRLQKTAENVLKIYAKSISGYGTFDANEILYPFPVLLRNYAVNGTDFIGFTESTTDLIAKEMSSAFFATGGYALFLRYINQGQDWLLVVMLKLKAGTGINQTTLELLDTLTFDVDHLHEAARIDLGRWQRNQQPYLSFIKKRSGGEDVTLYFRKALGCTEYNESKHNTQQMRDAVEAYCLSQDWTTEQKREARRRVYEYCEAKTKAEEPVNLTALSAVVNDQQPDAFVGFVRENGYEVSETFKPHKETYVRFKRISRQFGSVKVSFDVQDLMDGRVDYDETSNSLVISDLPEELIKEIKTHKAKKDEPAT